jgi:hypothetical protein
MDDFEKVDAEVEVLGLPEVVQANDDGLSINAPKDMMELRDNLVKEYHKGASTLAGRLDSQGKNSLDEIVLALVDEIIKETDNLLGNELISAKGGNLRDASVISYKRSEVLEKAIKAVQAKQIFEKEHGVDINSPSMMVVFKYFMNKVKSVFVTLGYEDEASDTFFRILGDDLTDWKKQLKEELSEINSLKG